MRLVNRIMGTSAVDASLIEEVINKALKVGTVTGNSLGKLVTRVKEAVDNPWHTVREDPNHDCAYWHTLMHMFPGVSKENPDSFIPMTCMECWKVVVRPKTLKQLFQLLDIMERLEQYPCKCGIERRRQVCGLYGGYFYNPSLEAGLECYRTVRAEVDKELGEDVMVILKRGCTEYELGHGDSKNWEVLSGQREVEDLLLERVMVEYEREGKPIWFYDRTHRKWIDWAYQNGDQTYLEFTDGKPLYPGYRTYHHLVDSSPEEIEKWWRESEHTSAREEEYANSSRQPKQEK